MVVEQHLADHDRRLDRLEACVDSVERAVAAIQGSTAIAVLLIKFVIIPLMGIVAALVGIKLFLP